MADDLGRFDFEEQALEIARKRKLQELLQGAAIRPMELAAPDGRASVLNALVPMAQAFMGKRAGEGLDEQSRALAGQRQAGLDKWLGTMPQGTPGTEGSPMPPAELGGGPAQPPMLPTEPSPQDLMKWGSQGIQYGPAGQKIAEHAITQGMSSLIPKDPYKVVGSDIFNVKKGEFMTSPGTQATRDSLIQSRIDANDTRMEAIRQRGEDNEANRQLRRDIAAQNADLRRELVAAKGAQGGAAKGPKVVPYGIGDKGESVMKSQQGGLYTVETQDDGTVKQTPYKGNIVPNSIAEKNMTELADLDTSSKDASGLLAQVSANKDAFGPQSAWTKTPLIGQWIASKQFTPEQLAVRQAVSKDASVLLHKLYGAALTAGERANASQFVPDTGDPPEVIMAKLQVAQKWAESHKAKFPPGVRAAHGKRMGGEEAPAAESGGKTVTVDY